QSAFQSPKLYGTDYVSSPFVEQLAIVLFRLDVSQVLHDCHNSIGSSGCVPTALLPVAASIANQLLTNLAAVLDLYDRRPLDTDDVPVLASGQLWDTGSLLHISSLYSSVRTHAEVLVYKAPMPSSSGLLISSCAAPVVDNTTNPQSPAALRRHRRALASTHLPEVQEPVKPLLPSQPWPAASAGHGAELHQRHQIRQVLQGDAPPAPEESSSSGSGVDSGGDNSPGSDLEESSMEELSIEESSSDDSGSILDTGGEEGDWVSPSGTTAPPQSVLAFMDMPSTAVYEGPLDANTRQQWEYQALGRFDESGRLLGPQFPRTHLLLLYRLDWFNSLGLKPPNTWEELITVTLALRSLHGFSSGPGNLDILVMVGEVAPSDGLRLPAVQGSLDVRRWPQPGSLSSNWTLMPPGVPPALDSSEPKMALCLDLALHCKAGDLLAAILASLTQSKGTQQAGLAAGPGGHVAADQQPSGGRGLATVRPAGQPGPAPLQPARAPAKLLSPQPSLSYNSVDALDDVAQYGLQGRLGWAPLPGSTKVYDRQGQVLLPCTSELCPHATHEPVQNITLSITRGDQLNPIPAPPPAHPPRPSPPPPEQGGEVPILDGDGRGQEQPDVRSLPTLDESSLVMADPTLGFTNTSLEAVGVLHFPEPSIVLVNRAPYSALADTSVGLCRSGSSLSSTQLQALNDLFLSGPLVARQAFMTASNRVMRSAYIRATAGNTTPPAAALDGQFGNLDAWSRGRLRGTNMSLFLNSQDSLRYFNTLWRVRFAWPGNQAPQATLTDSTTQYVRMALSEAALAGLVSGLAEPQLFTPLNTSLRLTARIQEAMALEPSGKGVNNTVTGPAAVRDLYRKSIGYLPPPAPPSAPPPPSPSLPQTITQPSPLYNATDTKLISYIVSGVVSVLVLAGIGLVALLLVRRAQRRSLLGRVQAPAAGPGTTLLITDIQDSTVIWETLPADVTDQAVKLHHEVIRQSSIAHRGYECCTEGDSFILAFHTPNDAARFAVAAQAALVLAPWPQQLYEVEVCKPVWVSPVTNFKSLPQLLSTQPHLLDERHSPRPSLTLQTSASWEESSAQDAPKSLTRRNPDSFLTVRRPLTRFRNISWTAPALSVGAGAPFGACSDKFASGLSPFQWEQLYANPAVAAAMTDSSGTSALRSAMSTRTPLQSTCVAAVGAPAGIPPRSSGDVDNTGAYFNANDDGCSSSAAQPVAMYEHLKRLVPVAAGPGPGRVLIYQGLRVRMGMASGTSSAEEVTFSAASQVWWCPDGGSQDHPGCSTGRHGARHLQHLQAAVCGVSGPAGHQYGGACVESRGGGGPGVPPAKPSAILPVEAHPGLPPWRCAFSGPELPGRPASPLWPGRGLLYECCGRGHPGSLEPHSGRSCLEAVSGLRPGCPVPAWRLLDGGGGWPVPCSLWKPSCCGALGPGHPGPLPGAGMASRAA
ncbi:guanylate cyclase domain-containing protein, partial [Haematococcus lacustris]